jgi:ubiquinone/menaquinone biosynthesis C-methylase UbiE
LRDRRTDETVRVGPFSPEAVAAAYDAVAGDYEAAFGNDLAHLPLDREMLEAATGSAPEGGLALDLGCGTGAVGAYLAGLGRPVVGADLSSGMLRIARSTRRLAVAQGDMRRLPFADAAFVLITAYYSIQHVARHELPAVLGEMARVLRSGGALLLSAHLGEGEVVNEEFLGHAVEPNAGALYGSDELTGAVVEAGFEVVSTRERGPLGHEYPSERLYLLVRRPPGPRDRPGPRDS